MLDKNTATSIYTHPNSLLLFDKERPCCKKTSLECVCRVTKISTNRDKNTPLDKHWLEQYQAITKNNQYFVKVYATNGFNTIEMEKLDIVCDVRTLLDAKNRTRYKHFLTKELFLDIMIAMQVTWLRLMQFSRWDNEDAHEKREFVLHGDYHLGNLVITRDRKVKLIDPDSVGGFNLYDNMAYVRKYYVSQMELMNGFQDFYFAKELENIKKSKKRLLSQISDMNKNV